ncbi:hypothetical protein STEG23_038436, partial [Scotinomys teguina]
MEPTIPLQLAPPNRSPTFVLICGVLHRKHQHKCVKTITAHLLCQAKRLINWVREVAQELRAHIALGEDLGLVPSTRDPHPVTLVPGDPTPLVTTGTCIRAVHASLFGSSLLASFSGAVGCSLVILCFTSSIHVRLGFDYDIMQTLSFIIMDK